MMVVANGSSVFIRHMVSVLFLCHFAVLLVHVQANSDGGHYRRSLNTAIATEMHIDKCLTTDPYTLLWKKTLDECVEHCLIGSRHCEYISYDKRMAVCRLYAGGAAVADEQQKCPGMIVIQKSTFTTDKDEFCNRNANECEPRDCGPSPKPLTGEANIQGNLATIGSRLKYTCVLGGDVTYVTCQVDGTWSEAPSCRTECQDPPVDPEATMYRSNDTIAKYNCTWGGRVWFAECQYDGTWKGTSTCNLYADPYCDGKSVIADLADWNWQAIAHECEMYLAYYGFCGVQVSPPNEHVIREANSEEYRQPVSYKLNSDLGNETEFRDMVARCNDVGVRVFADVIINRMADAGDNGTGTNGSSYDSDEYFFPGVPYSKDDFDLDYCNFLLYGPILCTLFFNHPPTVLNQSSNNVRDKIASFLNTLIEIGVTGFRLDEAHQMQPEDIAGIQDLVHDVPNKGRPFFYLDLSNATGRDGLQMNEFLKNGVVTDFGFAEQLKAGIFEIFEGVRVHFERRVHSSHALVFVDDNYYQKRYVAGYQSLIEYDDVQRYEMAVLFLLAQDYGIVRLGDTTSYVNNGDFYKWLLDNCMDFPANLFNQSHRMCRTANMVRFRRIVAGTSMNLHVNVSSGFAAILRDKKGVFAMTQHVSVEETVQVELPAGTYCDLLTNCLTNITVTDDGLTTIAIKSSTHPYVAFVAGADNGKACTTDSDCIGGNTVCVTVTPIEPAIRLCYCHPRFMYNTTSHRCDIGCSRTTTLVKCDGYTIKRHTINSETITSESADQCWEFCLGRYGNAVQAVYWNSLQLDTKCWCKRASLQQLLDSGHIYLRNNNNTRHTIITRQCKPPIELMDRCNSSTTNDFGID